MKAVGRSHKHNSSKKMPKFHSVLVLALQGWYAQVVQFMMHCDIEKGVKIDTVRIICMIWLLKALKTATAAKKNIWSNWQQAKWTMY